MQPPPLYLERGSAWARAAAALIDYLIAVFPAASVNAIALALLDEAGAEARAWRYVLGVLPYLAPLAYTLYFEIFKGATPGKMALGLVIARHDGVPADRSTLAFRWMTKHYDRIWMLIGAAVLVAPVTVLASLVAGFSSLVLTVGLLQALDEERRTWHDQWSGTAVWKKPRAAAAPGFSPPPRWMPPLVTGAGGG